MFAGCVSLKGEVAYDKVQIGGSLENSTGYFTRVLQAYVHISEDQKTLTFYYDTLRADRDGTTWRIRGAKDHFPSHFSSHAWTGDWGSPNTTVLTAVFDASFRDFCPTTTAQWFYKLASLKSIEGLEHLNTSQVTDMSSMFSGCESLPSLDLSSFDTSEVTSMGVMFSDCQSLTALDLSSFDTSKVTYMDSMFSGCESLTTIYCNSSWSASHSDDMFSGCNSLRSAASSVGNSYDVSMANPGTGYFTKKVLS